MPATETDFEREFADLVAQLRELDTDAPDSLRAHVRALGEPAAPATLRDRWTTIRWRRAVLVAAPACLAVLLSVAAVRGLIASGGGGSQTQAAGSTVAPAHGAAVPAPTWGAFQKHPPLDTVRGTALSSGVGGSTGGRPAHVDASLRVRVADLDRLTDRTSAAMQIARSLGGYVASVEQSSRTGSAGEADLLLRVPVGKVDEALMRLSSLGTVLDQHLSIVDLKQTLDQERRRIQGLRYQVARLQQALQDPSLPADVRLRLQFQLQAARESLGQANGGRKQTLQQAAISDVSLVLTTPRAAGATKHHEGRFGRAAHDAGAFLVAAGAVALFVLIAVSPLAVLVALWLYGTRAYRRREERRLLAPAPE
jgi:Domain of unknown function (DUF4349)